MCRIKNCKYNKLLVLLLILLHKPRYTSEYATGTDWVTASEQRLGARGQPGTKEKPFQTGGTSLQANGALHACALWGDCGLYIQSLHDSNCQGYLLVLVTFQSVLLVLVTFQSAPCSLTCGACIFHKSEKLHLFACFQMVFNSLL